MSGYTKLFSSILTSTIWQEPKETKLLWITMLAMSNRDGVIEGSVPGLAKTAGLTIEEVVDGLQRLKDKDFWSRTKTNEGRRIEDVDGGWRLLNHSKYRELMNADERREYNRRKQAESRARQASKSVKDVNDIGNMSALSAHTDTREQIPDTKIPLAAKPRARNELCDSLARACGLNPLEMTPRSAQSCAVAAAQIRKVSPNADEQEFSRRALNYRSRFDGAALTPRALCDHWAGLDRTPLPRNQNPAPTAADHEKPF
jgi:hypothetical protein